MSRAGDPLLKVTDLKKHYPITKGFMNKEIGRARAVDGISFEIERGETFGIVGESGCGKSTAATSMIRLEEPTSGEVHFNGENILDYDPKQLRMFRREVQMIFQDPDSSFDPRMSIGDSVAEPLIVQGMTDRERRRAIVGDLLERVGLSASDMERYPHEFSGGQKQRIGLARALSVNPEFIVADEPVSALDVSVQSEILRLLDEFQRNFGLTMLIISHNLGVVREVCDRVAVMYLGEFVEVAPTEELFTNPKHPYTQALLSAIPTPDPRERGMGQDLKGDVPDPSAPPAGCRFHTRCPKVIPPEGINLPQSEWRNLLHFRKKVQGSGIDLDSIVKVNVLDDESIDDPTSVTADDIDADTLSNWIRREYELPQQLTDTTAETILSHALESIVDDDEDAAVSILNENFTTPCEEQKPALDTVEPGRQSACLLENPTEPLAASVGEQAQHRQSTD
ncbi:ABC transporter ATP-binding protein [Halovivax gelatinilyticus]|uniref:ABC transporter ATP-binding protein n=1 Tax=Halovivax gelatinilyticus TaxID=2961597 RepID=UPI0020CA2C07|nr:oligopeptide/dipeptide ABC transporter ATP-binding protein [Halovivax gelatinilyticus]